MADAVKGVVFVLILLAVGIGGPVLLTPGLLVLPFSLALNRKFTDWAVLTWFKMIPVSE